MRTIKEILVRKIHGIDCTEEESAEIKGYIREQKYNVSYEFQYHFTRELVEVLEEDRVQPIFFNTDDESTKLMNQKIQEELEIVRKPKHTLVCSNCGSDKVQVKAWVNANTNEYVSECSNNDSEDFWCEDCREHHHLNYKTI